MYILHTIDIFLITLLVASLDAHDIFLYYKLLYFGQVEREKKPTLKIIIIFYSWIVHGKNNDALQKYEKKKCVHLLLLQLLPWFIIYIRLPISCTLFSSLFRCYNLFLCLTNCNTNETRWCNHFPLKEPENIFPFAVCTFAKREQGAVTVYHHTCNLLRCSVEQKTSI